MLNEKLKNHCVKKTKLIQESLETNRRERMIYFESYKKYLFEMIAISGAFASITAALLASPITQIKVLTVIAFFLQTLCIIFVFWAFKKGINSMAPYIKHLNQIDSIHSEHSGKLIELYQSNADDSEVITEEDKYCEQLKKCRNSKKFFDIENEQKKEFDSINSFWNEINISFYLFILSIIMVFMSVLIPQISQIQQTLCN